MVQIRARNRFLGAQASAMAAVVAALMALAAIGGYEIGLSRAQSDSSVAQPSAAHSTPSPAPDAPPTTGFIP